jgi:transcriptional regulator with XRE-family HTH domain
MEWNGEKIRGVAQAQGVSLTELATQLGVSRQTVNDWINGRVPKGNHLILLCNLFDVDPNLFFVDDTSSSIVVPVHRTRQNAKVRSDMQKEALELAREYRVLLQNATNSELLSVIRVSERDTASAKDIAERLREESGIDAGEPIDYQHTFKLLEKSGIKVIFRQFPTEIKSYAFYTEIHKHRVVFVNNSTSIVDLIFPLLHETVHAIRDEVHSPVEGYDPVEEKFCDEVASYVQFPGEYVDFVYSTISSLGKGAQVNTLKNFGERYKHALYGITKRIEAVYPDFQLSVGGADTNFRKNFPTIGDILFESDDHRSFIERLSLLTPNFVEVLLEQLDSISDRKLGELLGLESSLDGKLAKEELLKLNKVSLV